MQALGGLNVWQCRPGGKSLGSGAHGDRGELPEILEKHVQMWLPVVEFVRGKGRNTWPHEDSCLKMETQAYYAGIISPRLETERQ